MILKLLGLGKKSNNAVIDSIYGDIVARAREPQPYAEWQVPDTPLGRYEMLTIQMFAALEDARRRADPAVSAIMQEVVDQFFLDVDHSLRELGVGDASVPKRMKKLARMFYGRCESYRQAIEKGDDDELAEAIRRNVWPEDAPQPENPARLAGLLKARLDTLASVPASDWVSGRTGGGAW